MWMGGGRCVERRLCHVYFVNVWVWLRLDEGEMQDDGGPEGYSRWSGVVWGVGKLLIDGRVGQRLEPA